MCASLRLTALLKLEVARKEVLMMGAVICTHIDQIRVSVPEEVDGRSWCYLDDVAFVVASDQLWGVR